MLLLVCGNIIPKYPQSMFSKKKRNNVAIKTIYPTFFGTGFLIQAFRKMFVILKVLNGSLFLQAIFSGKPTSPIIQRHGEHA